MPKMQQRRGTAAQWTTAATVLLAGEIGFETDTGKFKIGDGTTAWASLAYQNISGAQGTTGTQGITGATGSQGATGPQGIQGVIGTQGTTGSTGATGIQGTTGTQGVQGTSGAASNSFTTIATPSGTSPVAVSPTDTLTLTAGTGITITGTAATDTVAIATNAASANGASTIVTRDASGNFAANVITHPVLLAPVTTVGTTISTVNPATPSTGYITYTTAAAHGLIAGQIVTIGSLSPSYTRTNVRIFSVPTTTTFVVESTTNIGPATSQTGTITTALLTIGNSASTIVLTNSPTATLPLFIARRTASQVIAGSTSTIVNFSTSGTIDLNRGGFTMASGVVTVPLTGYYRIKATAYWDAAVTTGNNKVALLYVNGSPATRVNAYGGLTYDFITETGIDRVYLEATVGTVDLRVYQTSASNVNLLSAGGLNNHQYGTSIYIEYLGN